MLTHLTHPVHGVFIAYSPEEVTRLTTLYGWTVRDDSAKPAAEKAPACDPAPRAKRKYTRRKARKG